MKKFYLSLSVLIMFFSFNAAAYSFETSSLNGSKFDIYLISTGEIEGYCTPFELKTDQISFSEDKFEIKGLKDMGIGSTVESDFSESIFVFDAFYENTFLLKKRYRFEISGLKLGCLLITGNVNIGYYKFEFGFGFDNMFEPENGPEYKLEQEAEAFFIGIRK